MEIGVGIFASNAMDGKGTEMLSRWSVVDSIYIRVRIPHLTRVATLLEPVFTDIIPQSNRIPVGLALSSWQEVKLSSSVSLLKSLRVVCQRRGIALEVDLPDEWSITQEVVTTVTYSGGPCP